MKIGRNEKIVSEWKNLMPEQKHILINEYTRMTMEVNINVTAKDLEKIFEEVKPKVVVGFMDGKPFMRMHKDSHPELVKKVTDKLL